MKYKVENDEIQAKENEKIQRKKKMIQMLHRNLSQKNL